jgi:N-methylhydantoinase B
MPLVGTVDIAIWVTLRSILLDAATHDPVPTNSGLFRAVKIVAPEGCIANPSFPAPTIARFCSGNIIADTMMRALAPVLPEGVSAGVGNLKVVAYSGFRGGQHWVYMDIQEGSYGGRYGKDGLDAVDTLYANTRNNPIEDIESHFPLRVTQYELLEDVGGPGKWRGGLGTAREIEFLDDAGCSLEGDGSVHAPPGLFGGKDGTPGAVLLNRGTGGELELPSKFPYRKVAVGDRLCLISPCGGGYGDPLERDQAAVESDIVDGYVSREAAAAHYGRKEST